MEVLTASLSFTTTCAGMSSEVVPNMSLVSIHKGGNTASGNQAVIRKELDEPVDEPEAVAVPVAADSLLAVLLASP